MPMIKSIRFNHIKPKPERVKRLAERVQKALRQRGFDNYTSMQTGTSLNVQNIRLSDERVRTKGFNVAPFTGRRGRVLGWNDWVEVNSTMNKVLDREKVSANVSSLGGKFKIREGKRAWTENDWIAAGLAYENVGSVVHPVDRIDAWVNEKEWKRRRMQAIF